MTCREGIDRKKVVPYIESKGIQTRMLFAGNLIKHPCFDEMRKSGQAIVSWAASPILTVSWKIPSGWGYIRG